MGTNTNPLDIAENHVEGLSEEGLKEEAEEVREQYLEYRVKNHDHWIDFYTEVAYIPYRLGITYEKAYSKLKQKGRDQMAVAYLRTALLMFIYTKT